MVTTLSHLENSRKKGGGEGKGTRKTEAGKNRSFTLAVFPDSSFFSFFASFACFFSFAARTACSLQGDFEICVC